jgi:hypothetical protein
VSGYAAADPPVASCTADVFSLYGYRFGFTARSPGARRLMRRLYGAFRADAGVGPAPLFRLETRTTEAGRVWRGVLDDGPLPERRSLGSALRQLEYRICLRVIAHHPELMTLHAATVYGADGAAVIAGPSGAGKTTLTLALAARGFRIGGDDIAFFDPTGREIRPVPRCFHLDARSRRLLRQLGLRLPDAAVRHGFACPADLGTTCPAPAPPRYLIFLDGRDRGLPRLAPVPQAEMVVRLVTESGWPGCSPAGVLMGLRRLVTGAACYRLTGGRLYDTAEAVAGVLAPP